jgi:hypothetical protein
VYTFMSLTATLAFVTQKKKKNSNRVIIGSRDDVLPIRGVSNRQHKASQCACSPDGQHIISGSLEKTIQIFYFYFLTKGTCRCQAHEGIHPPSNL